MIKKIEHFNLKHIAESGQCFRMNPLNDKSYGIVAFNRFLKVTQIDEERVEFHCKEEEFNEIWKDYFHLDYDYKGIVEGLRKGDDIFLQEAVNYGGGLRILKQEPFEALISFIISQNKNIPAIKSSIERLSALYGDKIEAEGNVYYTFPTPERLALAEKDVLRTTGLGYRDEYIINTSKAIINKEIDLNELIGMTHKEAVNALLTLHGVGVKVANCVSLYGLHHIDAFPIDLWIKRILKEIYNDNFQLELYEGYAGIVQQYMFYYMRNKDK